MQQIHKSRFDSEGYFVEERVLSKQECERIATILPKVDGSGTRKLLELEEFQRLGKDLQSKATLSGVLNGLSPIQCTLFHKTAERNWSVSLHRDQVITASGDGPWATAGVKDGMNCVKPPFAFLRKCVAVRLALDECNDGGLKVISGSHNQETGGTSGDATLVRVSIGGALVLRPTILHCSSKLATCSSRRVLHYLFAPSVPPHNYRWYHAA